jgi:hypothetical protein
MCIFALLNRLYGYVQPHTNLKSSKKMEELVNKIKAEFEAFATDANLQVEKGNKAAGTRARKASLDLEKLLKEFRKASLTSAKN